MAPNYRAVFANNVITHIYANTIEAAEDELHAEFGDWPIDIREI